MEGKIFLDDLSPKRSPSKKKKMVEKEEKNEEVKFEFPSESEYEDVLKKLIEENEKTEDVTMEKVKLLCDTYFKLKEAKKSINNTSQIEGSNMERKVLFKKSIEPSNDKRLTEILVAIGSLLVLKKTKDLKEKAKVLFLESIKEGSVEGEYNYAMLLLSDDDSQLEHSNSTNNLKNSLLCLKNLVKKHKFSHAAFVLGNIFDPSSSLNSNSMNNNLSSNNFLMKNNKFVLHGMIQCDLLIALSFYKKAADFQPKIENYLYFFGEILKNGKIIQKDLKAAYGYFEQCSKAAIERVKKDENFCQNEKIQERIKKNFKKCEEMMKNHDFNEELNLIENSSNQNNNLTPKKDKKDKKETKLIGSNDKKKKLIEKGKSYSPSNKNLTNSNIPNSNVSSPIKSKEEVEKEKEEEKKNNELEESNMMGISSLIEMSKINVELVSEIVNSNSKDELECSNLDKIMNKIIDNNNNSKLQKEQTETLIKDHFDRSVLILLKAVQELGCSPQTFIRSYDDLIRLFRINTIQLIPVFKPKLRLDLLLEKIIKHI